LSWQRSEIIAVCYARLRQAIPAAEQDFYANITNGRGDLRNDELVEVRIGVVAAEKKHRTATRRLGQFRPPDLELPQALNSSQLDQSSLSAAESGCFR
jgi:hypothetical protein